MELHWSKKYIERGPLHGVPLGVRNTLRDVTYMELHWSKEYIERGHLHGVTLE